MGPQALVLHMNRTCSLNAEQHYMIFQECCRGVSISTSRIFRKDQVEVVQMKAMERGSHQGTFGSPWGSGLSEGPGSGAQQTATAHQPLLY